jgi:hypothetical protein
MGLEDPSVKQLASALVLATALGLAPNDAFAQPVTESNREGWTPEGYLLSFGVGAYRPDPADPDWNTFYPDGNGPILLAEFDFFLYRIPFVGPIGIGLAGGWTNYKGGVPDTTQSAKFTLFPLNALAVLRIDSLARKTPVPLVFTGKVGFNTIFFREDIGGSGRTHGFGWAAQVALDLNFVNPRRANALDEDWGINSSFFYFELAGSDANSRASFGDKLYFLGGVGLTF